jgi:hypothetical protein
MTHDKKQEAWMQFKMLLESERLPPEQIALAREAFKEGWQQCELNERQKKQNQS